MNTVPAPQMIPAWKDGILVPMDKLAVHKQGLRHPAVSVFVLSQGQVLIQQRALGKYHTPGLWANTCCTHPFWNETVADCAYRRLAQELGITGLPLAHVGQVEYRADVGGGLVEHELVDVFLGKTATKTDLRIVADSAEVADSRWISLPDLDAEIRTDPARFTPWLRTYLADHRAMIFGDSLIME